MEGVIERVRERGAERGGGGRVGWDYQFQLSDILLAV